MCIVSLLISLQYGSGKTIGAKEGVNHPSYVYPAAIKVVVRARYPGLVNDWLDPNGPHVSQAQNDIMSAKLNFVISSLQVHHVTYGELAKAKWPTPKARHH